MSTTAYFVQYGRPAFVGRFTAPPDVAVERGERVRIRTPRGLEIGEVLCEAAERSERLLDPSAGGELLRTATPEDLANAEAAETIASKLLDTAVAVCESAQLPLAIVDVELLLEGSGAILHALPWGPCDADPLLADLSEQFGMPVRMLDLSTTAVAVDPPEKPATCGKPDCGSGSGGCSSCGSGGGCSTGSCSRGSVKSADDLTAYFANLRSRMEAQAARTPLS